MIPIKLTNDTWPPKDGEFCSSIVLYYDNWNDYSYRTSFVMCYCDADGMVREVGNVKIYYWQNDEVRTNQYSEHTKSSLGDHIESLSASYCSLGKPDIECFGNNISEIVFDVFDVTSVESNFKSHLRKLSQNKSYNDILELFDGNLSLNALIFLKSCYMGGD